MPLAEGLRIEAQCFNRSLYDPATIEGKRQFNERDHPDRRREQAARTPGSRSSVSDAWKHLQFSIF
jgi:enoyl-CoA hydratase